MKDPLPLVCYLLPLCDPNHGTVANLSRAYRGLEADENYRRECGYADRLPSLSVFRKTAATLESNWSRFQGCVLSSNTLERLLGRVSRDFLGLSESRSSGLAVSTFFAELQELGWNGNLPPLYRMHRDEVVSRPAPRLVDPSTGIICGPGSGVGSADGDAGISAVSQGDVAKSSNKRYRRDWRAYNSAQACELSDAKALLGGLADLINLVEGRLLGPRGKGRPRCPLGHVAFATVWKAYTGLSSRRLHSALEEAVEQGYLRDAPSRISRHANGVGPIQSSGGSQIPRFNTVGDCLRADWLTPLLLELVSVVAGPLREVDTVFAIDGTGLSTRIYDRWLDVRPGNKPPSEEDPVVDAGDPDQDGLEVDRRGWVKLHAVSAVGTNVFVRVAISPSNDHDSRYFRGLVSEAASRFDVRKVLADLAYSSRDSYALGEELGFNSVIPFKKNTRPPSNDGSPWSTGLSYFLEFPTEFRGDYYPRNNGESGYSSFKRLFPEQLRTKEFCGHVNESLCKVVAYNLSVLARQVRTRGIELDLPTEAMALEDCIGEVVEMRKPKPLERAA